MTENLETRLLAQAEAEAVQNKDDFVRGGKAAIDLLWNSVEEEPDSGKELLLQTDKGLKVYPNPKNSQTAWQFFVRISHAKAWAVSDELLPEEKKGE